MSVSNKNQYISQMKIGCAIPCYKGGNITLKLIKDLHEIVDLIVLVDDGCPFKTGNLIQNEFLDSHKLFVMYNKSNMGVGFSVKKAFKLLLKLMQMVKWILI